ncbi:MAG: Gfo/Idh/MocA family protein [Armatimonadota bacterium]
MSKKTRVGIIGLGGIAQKRHIPAFVKHPSVEVVAVCDTRPEVLESVSRELSAVPFATYDELIGVDELDVIDICTPNFLHADPALKALRAGKHVLVEKPIALNAKEGRAMVAAAEEAKKELMVAYCWRWHSGARALKRFVDAGDMGEIYYARVHALRRRGIPNWGVFTQKEKQGGGPLVDLGCHALDLALWLMGHPKPVAVSGQCYTKFGNRPGLVGRWGPWDHTKYDVEDFATGLVRFESGASLAVESSFAANIEKDVLNISLLGTEAGCDLDPLRIYREERGALSDVSPVMLPDVPWHETEIFEFIDAVRSGGPVPVPGHEGLMVSEIIDAIYRSSEEKREVEL